jgi:hypothetical protein
MVGQVLQVSGVDPAHKEIFMLSPRSFSRLIASSGSHAPKAVLVLVAVMVAMAASFPGTAQAAGPFQYHALTPCRIVDTRNPNGTDAGPALSNTGTNPRIFQIQGNCGVPNGAAAVTINVTIVSPNMTGPSGGGFLTLYPATQARPTVSTINFLNADSALANGAIVPLDVAPNDLAVYLGGIGTVHLLIDVTGYFQ